MALFWISVGLLSGTAFASAAARYPLLAPQLEFCGGAMFAGGLGLLGSMLPHVGHL